MISHILTTWLFLVGIYIFRFYLRYVEFADYMFCYACREMDTLNDSYDYIVVGLGSAGSVVVRRLAEDENLKILVLEAGAEGDFALHIPGISPLIQKSAFDWQYKTTSQKVACKAFLRSMSTWPMGKIVGGTHMLNNMIYTRGHKSDYTEWYKYTKDYCYEKDILPYFKKLENFMNDSESKLTQGSAVISDPSFFSSLADNVLCAAQTLKLPLLQDPLTANEGFTKPKSTVLKGKRWTTADHLLNLNKKNILIRTQITVRKVLLKENYEAYGVKYLYLNDYYYARAKKAVILCAGVIGSPKILMLSGIGPAKHLRSINIKPRVNLPVGDNLQDHVTTGLDLVLLNNASLDLNLKALLSPFTVYYYFTNSSGPWTTIGCDVMGFLSEKPLCPNKQTASLQKQSKKKSQPQLQFMVMPAGITSDSGVLLKSLVGLKKNVWTMYFQKINTTAISILPVVLHPKSRGTVRLPNNNPYSKPLINPNYLREQYDVDMLLKGIDFIKKLIKTEPMQDLGASLNENPFPGCERHAFDSRKYWECYVRHFTLTAYHPVGTCKMGDGISSVVDFNFKVRGTNKLYVVDGSVMPSLVSGNINGAIIMLAEKAVEKIQYHDYLNSYYSDVKEIFIPKLICDVPAKFRGRTKENSTLIIC